VRDNHKPIPVVEHISEVSLGVVEAVRQKFNELKNGNQNIQGRSGMAKTSIPFVEYMGENTESHETPKDYSIEENEWFGFAPFISV
jgi:hypothetical protein